MSFIFDALKKSEEERRRGEVPDLRTEHVPPPPARRPLKLWPALLVGGLLINAALFCWWLRPWQQERPAVSPTMPPPPASQPAPAAPPQTPVALTEVFRPNGLPPAPPGWSDLSREDPPAAPAKAPVAAIRPLPRPSSARSILPQLRDLPPDRRKALPELTFSLHYYDPDPAARLVRINGRILREGAVISDGLSLVAITSDGVILDWHGERFRAGDF